MLVEHIAQYFGGHHHDVRLGIDRGVTGEQAYLIRAVYAYQIMVFLIAESLDRSGIKRFDVAFLSQIDGKIGYHGFACAGRCGDQHIAAGLQCVVGFGLEIVKIERQCSGKTSRDRCSVFIGFLE